MLDLINKIFYGTKILNIFQLATARKCGTRVIKNKAVNAQEIMPTHRKLYVDKFNPKTVNKFMLSQHFGKFGKVNCTIFEKRQLDQGIEPKHLQPSPAKDVFAIIEYSNKEEVIFNLLKNYYTKDYSRAIILRTRQMVSI